ncbi:hypothetical protein [Sharpea azabuensis]
MNDLSKLTTSTNRQALLESMGLHTLEDVYMHLPGTLTVTEPLI